MTLGHTTPCGTGMIRSITHHGTAGVIRIITPGIRLAIMAITAIIARGMAVDIMEAVDVRTVVLVSPITRVRQLGAVRT